MFRSKKIVKPENLHSLEYLKYIHTILSKNQNVTDANRTLLVESFRSMAEILIWGDQNNPLIFDFFLENNMFNYFLLIMGQKCGNYVCVQLLQTLNIIFENIKNKTALYYLLSNNHVNSIIIYKLDFSDEDVLAYYISFLKTLSFKLNLNTIHFFYNEATNDFPLYTEAIKFFNHPDSMVRTYVRTLTLNVYKVEDESMLRFIRDKTCAPYFGNLVWFMGKHVLELDASARAKPVDVDTQKTIQDQYRVKLADLVSSHLDDLHYLNDILSLKVDILNEVLVEHLMDKLFIPYYIHSLAPPDKYIIVETEEFVDAVKQQPLMNGDICLFLLTQVFLIIHQEKLVGPLAKFLLDSSSHLMCQVVHEPKIKDQISIKLPENDQGSEQKLENNSLESDVLEFKSFAYMNITDEEKEILMSKNEGLSPSRSKCIESIYNQLEVEKSDSSALFGICLLYALSQNCGVAKQFFEGFLTPVDIDETSSLFVHGDEREKLIDKLVNIIAVSSDSKCSVRSVTLEMAIELLKKLTINENKFCISDKHVAIIYNAKEKILPILRQFFKKEEMFLELFEDEYNEMFREKLDVQRLMSDSTLLLPPALSPMTGIPLSKRLPCGDVEKTRHFICAFLLIRKLLMIYEEQEETQLPLVDRKKCFAFDTPINLNGNDLITCMIVSENGAKTRRYLSIINNQLVLVEPHSRFLGWGVCKLSCYLQDTEVTKIDNETKTLHITMHGSKYKITQTTKLMFDDHIRCNAARQKLLNGRVKARRKQLAQIANLLEMSNCETSYATGNPTQKQKHGHQLRIHYTDVAVHTSGVIPSYSMSIESTGDEYSADSNCSSIAHSRDSSPISKLSDDKDNSRKSSLVVSLQEKNEPKRKDN
ncbi:protein CLEC16A homolog isoform X7 [Daktulosphaira vitifoliae]|uniref:protein CLEC16A homolog isoform X7 n=1 Tax=Daktulosphaira vitifoliae TaxID=58002 RepID=UPI0021AAC9E5|nr:protein CLEC16A homolog isoform X7 [Daktulosphaira vitifoliae]